MLNALASLLCPNYVATIGPGLNLEEVKQMLYIRNIITHAHIYLLYALKNFAYYVGLLVSKIHHYYVHSYFLYHNKCV